MTLILRQTAPRHQLESRIAPIGADDRCCQLSL
jgi:hypothetical protein